MLAENSATTEGLGFMDEPVSLDTNAWQDVPNIDLIFSALKLGALNDQGQEDLAIDLKAQLDGLTKILDNYHLIDKNRQENIPLRCQQLVEIKQVAEACIASINTYKFPSGFETLQASINDMLDFIIAKAEAKSLYLSALETHFKKDYWELLANFLPRLGASGEVLRAIHPDYAEEFQSPVNLAFNTPSLAGNSYNIWKYELEESLKAKAVAFEGKVSELEATGMDNNAARRAAEKMIDETFAMVPPFFLWLEAQQQWNDAAGLENAVAYHKDTKAQVAARLSFTNGGQVHIKVKGDLDSRIFSTNTMHGREAAFVMIADPSGKRDAPHWILAGPHIVSEQHHSTFVGGKPVLAAGMMSVNDEGKITKITNKSGHYKPSVFQLMRFVAEVLAKAPPIVAQDFSVEWFDYERHTEASLQEAEANGSSPGKYGKGMPIIDKKIGSDGTEYWEKRTLTVGCTLSVNEQGQITAITQALNKRGEHLGLVQMMHFVDGLARKNPQLFAPDCQVSWSESTKISREEGGLEASVNASVKRSYSLAKFLEQAAPELTKFSHTEEERRELTEYFNEGHKDGAARKIQKSWRKHNQAKRELKALEDKADTPREVATAIKEEEIYVPSPSNDKGKGKQKQGRSPVSKASSDKGKEVEGERQKEIQGLTQAAGWIFPENDSAPGTVTFNFTDSIVHHSENSYIQRLRAPEAVQRNQPGEAFMRDFSAGAVQLDPEVIPIEQRKVWHKAGVQSHIIEEVFAALEADPTFAAFIPAFKKAYTQDHGGGHIKAAVSIKIDGEDYRLENKNQVAAFSVQEGQCSLRGILETDVLVKEGDARKPPIPLVGSAEIGYEVQGKNLIPVEISVSNPLLMMAILSPQGASPTNLVAILQLQDYLDKQLLQPWRFAETMYVALTEVDLKEFQASIDDDAEKIAQLKINVSDIKAVSAQFLQALSARLRFCNETDLDIEKLKLQLEALSTCTTALYQSIDTYQRANSEQKAAMIGELNAKVAELQALQSSILAASIDGSLLQEPAEIIFVQSLQAQMLAQIADELRRVHDSKYPIDAAINLEQNQAYQSLQQIKQILKFEADVEAYVETLGVSEFALGLQTLKSILSVEVWDSIFAQTSSNVELGHAYNDLAVLASLASLELRVQTQLETLGKAPYRLTLPELKHEISTIQEALRSELAPDRAGLTIISEADAYKKLAWVDQYLTYLHHMVDLESQLKNYAKAFQGADDRLAKSSYLMMQKVLKENKRSYAVNDFDLSRAGTEFKYLVSKNEKLAEAKKAFRLDVELIRYRDVFRFGNEALAVEIQELRTLMFQELTLPPSGKSQPSAYERLAVIKQNLAAIFELETISDNSGIDSLMKECETHLSKPIMRNTPLPAEDIVFIQGFYAGVMGYKELLLREIVQDSYDIARHGGALSAKPAFQALKALNKDLCDLNDAFSGDDTREQLKNKAALILAKCTCPEDERVFNQDAKVIEVRRVFHKIQNFPPLMVQDFLNRHKDLLDTPPFDIKIKMLDAYIVNFMNVKKAENFWVQKVPLVQPEKSFADLLDIYLIKSVQKIMDAEVVPTAEQTLIRNQDLTKFIDLLKSWRTLQQKLGQLKRSSFAPDQELALTLSHFIAHRGKEILQQLKHWDGDGEFSKAPSVQALLALSTPDHELSQSLDAVVAAIPQAGSIWARLKNVGYRVAKLLFGVSSAADQLSSNLEKQNFQVLTKNLQTKSKRLAQTLQGSPDYPLAEALGHLLGDLHRNVRGQSSIGTQGDTLRAVDTILEQLLVNTDLRRKENLVHFERLAVIFEENEQRKLWAPLRKLLPVESAGARLCRHYVAINARMVDAATEPMEASSVMRPPVKPLPRENIGADTETPEEANLDVPAPNKITEGMVTRLGRAKNTLIEEGASPKTRVEVGAKPGVSTVFYSPLEGDGFLLSSQAEQAY